MNRKNNPWISLIGLVALILIFVMICTGCEVPTAEAAETEIRFTVEYGGKNLEIITDNETGVQYLAYRTPSGTGLTKLEVAENVK